MAVKRPIPYTDGTGVYKAAAAMQSGDLVYLSAANTITKATAGGTNNANAIGVVLRDEKWIAANGTDVYAASTPVPIKFIGHVCRLVAGAPITVGNHVRQAASGQVIAEATATIATVATIGIALETVGTSAEVDILVK
jgi:hypothetical protein